MSSQFPFLCWFQTSLPVSALLLRRVIIACCFRVAALSGNAALAFHRAAIAPELNRIQLSAICRGGQSGKVIGKLVWNQHYALFEISELINQNDRMVTFPENTHHVHSIKKSYNHDNGDNEITISKPF